MNNNSYFFLSFCCDVCKFCAKLISYIISLNPHTLWFELSSSLADEETKTQRRSVICQWLSQDSKPETWLQPKFDFVDSINMGLRLPFMKLGWVDQSRMDLFICKRFTGCLVPDSVFPFFPDPFPNQTWASRTLANLLGNQLFLPFAMFLVFHCRSVKCVRNILISTPQTSVHTI